MMQRVAGNVGERVGRYGTSAKAASETAAWEDE
jgi:hypothetical protein